MRLRGKSIVIVGGTAGIGFSTAMALQREGAELVAVGLDAQSCQAAEITLGSQAIVLMADATRPETAPQAIQIALKQFGRFDGLYHVAGGSGRRHGDGGLHELSDQGIEYTLQLNLVSTLYSNRAAVQVFLERQRPGVVLNLASVLACHPAPRHFGTVVYAASKAAILGMTRSAAAMYASHNVRFNALAPGLVDTESARRAMSDPQIRAYIAQRQPLDGGRAVKTSDLDAAAVYLLSDEAKFVTGQTLTVDGGWSLGESLPSDIDFPTATHDSPATHETPMPQTLEFPHQPPKDFDDRSSQ
jgi:NAD(P)-dependent dehydrogenase (short-subunit alcohol dehydrogenase family)